MPQSKYIRFTIDNKSVDLQSTESVPISISYKLEDLEDFQKKTSGDAFDIKVPATLNNDQIGNTFHSPGIEDLTPVEDFKRPRKAVLEANGYELLVGKAFLKSASHADVPLEYEYDCYGDNANWLIDLKESTLYDFLKHLSFVFDESFIRSSWAFDGRSESLPLVFAPVRYREKMGDNDDMLAPEYFKPSLSVYWIIYWGFKSLGYRVQSSFFDTDYFRRTVMPWTWGNFLFSDGTSQDNLKFLARSESNYFFRNDYDDFVDLEVTNDNVLPGYDNNNMYSYISANKEMRWTYKPTFGIGHLAAAIHVVVDVYATVRGGAHTIGRLHWYVNGVEDTSKIQEIYYLGITSPGKKDFIQLVEINQTLNVFPGDYVSCKVSIYLANDIFYGSSNVSISINTFELAYTRVLLDSTISFSNFTGFKDYKFLDFFRGIIDAFNLSLNTDPISKVVLMEPTHPYSVTNDFSHPNNGYFNGNSLDWNSKQDISKVSTVDLFSDYERELLFKFKDDPNDGILKVVQDRNKTTLATGKYVLPDRFKAGKKQVENRFFSPVMHYDVLQWEDITGNAPQMICLIPENISNTSESAAQNTFLPKLAWYKGEVPSVGWKYNGSVRTTFPFMFAVNYRQGNGENDPIFSYSDERISGTVDILGRGLLRRFYWQRMANMRNGQNYNTWFKLNNFDVTNQFHREHKIVKGQKWELIEIKGYKPLTEETTECTLRKWTPISQKDQENTFPSHDSVILSINNINSFDTVYKELKALSTDIPK